MHILSIEYTILFILLIICLIIEFQRSGSKKPNNRNIKILEFRLFPPNSGSNNIFCRFCTRIFFCYSKKKF